MGLGIIGKKVGMTQLFSESGEARAVTVVHVPENQAVFVDKRSSKNEAGAENESWLVRLAFKEKEKSIKKSGNFAFSFSGTGPAPCEEGAVLSISDIVKEGTILDATGVSQGKGFAGTIKRYNFNSGRASHGNSKAHNLPGSIGMAQDPGRVFPGKRMAGRMGGKRVTVQSLFLEKIDVERNLILVHGAIPGHKGSFVVLRPAAKVSNVGSTGGE